MLSQTYILYYRNIFTAKAQRSQSYFIESTQETYPKVLNFTTVVSLISVFFTFFEIFLCVLCVFLSSAPFVRGAVSKGLN